MTKVKYTSGKKTGQIVELEDLQSKSLIEDGLAEAVMPSAEDAMVANLETKMLALAEEVATKAASKAVETVTKAIPSNRISVGSSRELLDPTGGFKGITHFLLDVKRSGDFQTPTSLMSKYLKNEELKMKTAGATPSGTEGTQSLTNGQTGDGAAIPVEYLGEILKMYGEQPNFAEMCFPVQMNSLSAHIPVLRNYDRSNTNTSLGLVPGEVGEGNVINNSKLNWEQRLMTVVVESIMAPVTNETLSDNSCNWGAAVAGQAVYQLRKRINGGIINGLTTSCTGLLGSSGTTGTGVHASTKIVGRGTVNTISFTDIINMFAYFDHEGANYGSAVWLAHPAVVATIFTSTVGNYPAMITPGGGRDNLPLTILGRPVYLTGYAAPLGTTGDLTLVDFKQVLFGYRGGIESFVSPHVFATSYQTGFRFVQRVNGQPLRTGLVTLEDGTTKVSSTVTLGQVGGLS